MKLIIRIVKDYSSDFRNMKAKQECLDKSYEIFSLSVQ